MNYCPNCGKKIESVNFCSNCGSKIKSNVIDEKIDQIKLFKNELSESKYINEAKNKTILLSAKIFIVLAYISTFTLSSQIVLSIVMKDNLLYINSYINNNTAGFIGELFATTLLPLYFLYIGSKFKKNLKTIFIVMLMSFVTISLYEFSVLREKIDLKEFEEQELTKKEIINNTDSHKIISNDSLHTYNLDNNQTKTTLKNQEIYYNDIYYAVNIEAAIDTWGEAKVILKKNNRIITSQDFNIWNGNLQDFKISDKYVYFASPIAGGTAGNFYIEYFCIDLSKELIYSITYECNELFENCRFTDLTSVKKDNEAYQFMVANIRLPKPNDNYFNN